jgi:Family of unknown function (DUF5995)
LTEELRRLLEAKPAMRVADVIARMKQIVTVLPPGDGVRAFTALYLAVTEAVDEAAKPGAFEDAPFVRRLDVVFANHFFGALRNALLESGPVPKSWAPLLKARGTRGVLPLQFALAGMNAHINRDLPVALVATCRELRLGLGESSPQHADFERVDVLLAQVEKRVKSSYLTGWLAWADRLVHRIQRIDDVVAMWDVDRARDAAWTNAQALWALGDEPLAGDYLVTLDRMVGFASRGLLIPADSWLMKLGRGIGRDGLL